jgi:hypothetical protein
MLKKLGLIVAILVLWVLDDFVIFLPNEAVWVLVGLVLKAFGEQEHLEGLKAYWLGTNDG